MASDNDVVIMVNPSYAGMQPHLLEPACHDRSPMLEIRCTCGADSHLHETQLGSVPDRFDVGVRCSGCSETLFIRAHVLRETFAQMRKEGWYE